MSKRVQVSFAVGSCVASLCLALLIGCPTPQAPVAAFVASVTSGPAPLAVHFQDHSLPGSSPITQWIWDFGDGTGDTAQNPDHVYSTAGNFNATLTVTSDAGSNSTSNIIAVAPPILPTADFIADTLDGVAPLTVRFFDQSIEGSAPITSWLWEFGDGASSPEENPVHVYDAGSFSVTLTVTTSEGSDNKVKQGYIVVSPGSEGEGEGEGEGQEQAGSLTVALLPVAAAADGGQWSIDDGLTWNGNEAVLGNLAVGNVTVTFKDIVGWTTPVPQIAPIHASQMTTATGTYVAKQYALALSVNGGHGTLTAAEPAPYAFETVVHLTATPDTGYHIQQWQGTDDDTSALATNTVAITGDKSVAVTFLANPPSQYALTVNVAGQGTVALEPPDGTYNAGTNVTLTPSAATGWHFDHWEGALSGSANPATITMIANSAVTAVFVQNPVARYVLAVNITGQGAVALTPPDGTYDAGTSVALTATAASGWYFDHWTGDLTGNVNPTSVTMNADKNLTAAFTQSGEGEGEGEGEGDTVVVTIGSGSCAVGDEVTIPVLIATDDFDLSTIFIKIGFDKASLAYQTAAAGPVLIDAKKAFSAYQPTDGDLTITVYGGDATIKSGEFCTIMFKAVATGNISLRGLNFTASDAEANPVPVVFHNGQIQITPPG